MRGIIYPHMRLSLGLLILVIVGTPAADAEQRDGRLTADCEAMQRYASLPAAEASKYCRWMVRYEGAGQEQKEIEAVLGELTLLQPPQFDGNRSSVLAKKKSGQIVVIYLEKLEGTWRQISSLEGTGKKTKSVAP
jgi:hypothetical protein